MNRPHLGPAFAALAAIVFVGALCAKCSEPAARHPIEVRRVGASFSAVGFRVTTTRAEVGAVLAILRVLDGVRIPSGGVPSSFTAPCCLMLDSTSIGGTQAPGPPTLHRTAPRWNHDDPNRVAIPVELGDDLVITALQNRCAADLDAGALPDGGPVPGWCAGVVAIAARQAAVAANWDTGDGGPPWWCLTDSGMCADPSLPDDADGGTL
jgi:hypothetical protein